MSYPMKKLVIENDEYEIVDDSARTRLDGHDTRLDGHDAAIAGKADAQDVSDIEDVIGTGTLDTDAQTIIPAINEVNEKSGVETFTATRSNAINRGDCFGIYDKATNTVRLNFHFYHTADIPSSYILFTVPEKYKPKTQHNGSAIYVTNSGVSAFTCYIYTNGSIYQNLGNTIRQGFGVIEYVLD